MILSVLLKLIGVSAILYSLYQVFILIQSRKVLKKRIGLEKTGHQNPVFIASLKQTGDSAENWLNRMEASLEKILEFSEVGWSINRFVTYSLACAALFSLGGTYGLNNSESAVFLVFGGLFLPFAKVYVKASKKRLRINDNLVAYLITTLNRYSELRNIRTALVEAAQEARYPITNEVSRLADRLNAGRPVHSEVKLMAERLGNSWLKSAADIIQYHEELGSDLAEPMTALIYEMEWSIGERKSAYHAQAVNRWAFTGMLAASVLAVIYLSQHIPRMWFYFTKTAAGQEMTYFLTILVLFSFVLMIFQRRGGE